jgi:Tetratricopeptide repeat
VTIVSMCRLIRTTAAPQTPPPAKPATPTRPEPSETSRRDSDVNTCSQGNSRDALDACSQLINLSGLNLGDLTIAYFRRAQLYFSNGDYDRAIADFSAFIRLRPNSVVAFNERGLSFGKKGDYDKAIADYTEAIRLNPVWSALPYYNRGTAYEKKGELEKALADFREALNKGSTTVSEDINRVEWAIESLRKEKSREIIWKNYPHLNGDDKRALAIYPEILPPPEYDYPRILINWLDGLTHEELAAYCNNPKAISPPTKTFVRDTLVGCARGERNPCRVYLAREDVITAAGLTLNLVKRHMIGRCNGWPDDHAGARRSTMMPRLHGPVVGEGCRVADPSGTPLNIRSSPKGGSIRGALSNDTVVKVLEVRGDWARIKPHGGCTQSILNGLHPVWMTPA